jgi:hypothetical protein
MLYLLEIKSVVVHFQCLAWLLINLGMLGEGQVIRELRLGGVNPDRMRKWVRLCMCQKA